MLKFRSAAYNFDRKKNSELAALVCLDDSKTDQSAAESADINYIMKRFAKTGVAPGSIQVPSYDQYDDVFDFQTAMNVQLAAQAEFMKLDAHVRARFGNSPQSFLEFCSNKDNLPEMRKMGLAVPEEVPPPEIIQKVEVVNSPKV